MTPEQQIGQEEPVQEGLPTLERLQKTKELMETGTNVLKLSPDYTRELAFHFLDLKTDIPIDIPTIKISRGDLEYIVKYEVGLSAQLKWDIRTLEIEEGINGEYRRRFNIQYDKYDPSNDYMGRFNRGRIPFSGFSYDEPGYPNISNTNEAAQKIEDLIMDFRQNTA